MGDPAMTEHIGGPESPEAIAQRQALYERLADTGRGRMFRIVLAATDAPVGWTGYWERTWRGQAIYEGGWSVLLPFQGRGIAGRATAQALSEARTDRKHRFLHAFPSLGNGRSNAICRRLGFTLVGECLFEYPPGRFTRSNDWRLDLLRSAPSAS
jgi:RimJ/RimL family protein N-acetyltransferase